MNITNIIYRNKTINKNNVNNFVPKKPAPFYLMQTLSKDKISIACIIKDKYERTLLISPFGTTQINQSYASEKMDVFDGGLAPTGIYSYCSLEDEEDWTFDLIIYYEVELIVSGENMVGYYLIQETSAGLYDSIELKDYDLFEKERKKLPDSQYISTFDFENFVK